MILDTRLLKKKYDILNSEGSILGLYSIGNTKFYLGSYLKDGSGVIYYSTTIELMKKYLNSEIILEKLYTDSEDFIVTRKNRSESVSFLKEDMKHLIQCGENFYSEISASMKNTSFEKYLRSI